ncbi:hypothetical protein CLOM_g5504 [Closterium sp. NIES-68]|nr:hypothetical protein CLOM_g5504 [Closterium sp. NIES-68]GJP69354.1 hypothetical protein CLOP_g289 [Closterium sp. NIES-67]
MMSFVHQFSSLAKKRQFLERRDFFDELLKIEIAEGNIERAAEMRLKKGEMVEAAMLFLEQERWGRAFECAMGAARVASMWANGNKGWPLNARERERTQGGVVETREVEGKVEVGKDAGAMVRVKGEKEEVVPSVWEGRVEEEGSEKEKEGTIENAVKSEEEVAERSMETDMDALETAVAVWERERKARGLSNVRRDVGEESTIGVQGQGLGRGAGGGKGEVDEREGMEAITLLWLRNFRSQGFRHGKERGHEDMEGEVRRWWQLLTQCRSHELLEMMENVEQVRTSKGGESAVVKEGAEIGGRGEGGQGEEALVEQGGEELGTPRRSLAAEVLVSWKALELSIQRAKASLSQHAKTPPLPHTTAPLLPSPIKPATKLPSQTPPSAPSPPPTSAAPAIPLRPAWQQGSSSGTPQQLQQQEQKGKEVQQEQELPFEAELSEVKYWWRHWSERVGSIVSALQRLQRRRELPTDAPWLDATFHLLAVSSPSSSSSHSATHSFSSSSAQSLLVGLSSAQWLNPVRAAVNRLPNQGTRGEIAREAAARAGAIYWARQASEMVKEFVSVKEQVLRVLEKGAVGKELGGGNNLGTAWAVPQQGGMGSDRAWQEKERGEAEDRKRAREMDMQLELWVEIYGLQQCAVELCGGGRSEQKEQEGGEKGEEGQAGGSVGEGGIAQLAGEVERWKEQQERATVKLLALLFPVTSPLPRSLAFVVGRWREDERARTMMQRWACACVQTCLVEGRKEALKQNATHNAAWQQEEVLKPLVPVGLMSQLVQVLPYLGPWWMRRECQELLALMPDTRVDVCARMLLAGQWEEEALSFTLQHPTLLCGTFALDLWGFSLYRTYKVSTLVLLLLHFVSARLWHDVSFLPVLCMQWCRWDQKDGFVSFPTFLNLIEKAAVHLCAAITNLDNLVIPTSLASLHLEGQHHSSLCTHMLLWNFNKNRRTLTHLHSNVLSLLLHAIIRFFVFEPEALLGWMNRSNMSPSDHGSVFLRLVILITFCVSNVGPSFRQPFFDYMLGHLATVFCPKDKPPNPFVHTLPLQLQKDLATMSSRSHAPPTPNQFYDKLCRHMWAMRDPWVLLRRRGSWVIPGHVWKAQLVPIDVEFTMEVDGKQSFPVFSLVKLTGFHAVYPFGGGSAIVDDTSVEQREVGEEVSGSVEERGEEGPGSSEGKTAREAGSEGGAEGSKGNDMEERMDEGDGGGMNEGTKEVEQELKNAQLQSDAREEVDGIKIAVWISQQLRNSMHQARERLQQELSPLQQCSREARRVLTGTLQSVGLSERAFYLQEYEEHACPVKVETDAFLVLIHEGVRQLKQVLQQEEPGTGQGQQRGQGRALSEAEAEKHEELLEQALDAAESLEAATSVIHHSHSGHVSASVKWLHSTAIAPLSDLLSQHKSLENPLKKLLHTTEKKGDAAQAASGKGGSGGAKQGGSSGVSESGGGKGKGKKGGGRGGGKDGGGVGGKGGKKQQRGKSKR